MSYMYMYKAYISYHMSDKNLVQSLQSELLRFSYPWSHWFRPRSSDFFCDLHAHLSAESEVQAQIEEGLRSSEFFILLASPSAAESKFTNYELKRWLSHRGSEKIVIALADGQIVWDQNRNDFDWAQTTALPPILAGRFREKPKWIDLREWSSDRASRIGAAAIASILSRRGVQRTSSGNFKDSPSIARDSVDCSVFAPQRIPIETQVLIQVSAHMPEQAGEVEGAARESDPDARRRGATTLSTKIARGSQLTLALRIPHLRIDTPVQEIIWHGRPVSIQFSVTAPKNLLTIFATSLWPVSSVASLSVSQDGVVIGQIKFILKIVRSLSVPDEQQQMGKAKRYHTAFISYASENRSEVLRRVQMLSMVGITYFHDLLSLDPGERWAQQLYHHIDTSDVLFLFWSTPAKQSKWVTKEWRYGLKQKGLDFIQPVIIEGPPPVPPPRALADLQFNDRLLYVIRGEEAARGG
jgi:hypothetical protein